MIFLIHKCEKLSAKINQKYKTKNLNQMREMYTTHKRE